MKKRSSLSHFADSFRCIRCAGWFFPAVLLFFAAALETSAENVGKSVAEPAVSRTPASGRLSPEPMARSVSSSVRAPETRSPFAILAPDAVKPNVEKTSDSVNSGTLESASSDPDSDSGSGSVWVSETDLPPAPPKESFRDFLHDVSDGTPQIRDPQVVSVGYADMPGGAEESGTAGPLRYAMLGNGMIIHGSVRFVGDLCEITTGTGTRSFPKDQVDIVADSRRQIYEWRTSQIFVNDQEKRCELIQWCFQHEMLPEASEQLALLRQTVPDHRILPVFERRLEFLQRKQDEARLVSNASAVGNFVPAESLSVSENRNVSGQVLPNGEVGGTSVDGSSVEGTGAAFVGGSVSGTEPFRPLGPTPAELDQLADSLPKDSIEIFRRKIQPILQRNCMTAGCHGPDSETRYRLLRISSQMGRGAVLQNIHASLQQIHLTQPELSPFLRKPVTPHSQDRRIIFANQDYATYQLLIGWTYLVAQNRYVIPQERLLPSSGSAPVYSPTSRGLIRISGRSGLRAGPCDMWGVDPSLYPQALYPQEYVQTMPLAEVQENAVSAENALSGTPSGSLPPMRLALPQRGDETDPPEETETAVSAETIADPAVRPAAGESGDPNEKNAVRPVSSEEKPSDPPREMRDLAGEEEMNAEISAKQDAEHEMEPNAEPERDVLRNAEQDAKLGTKPRAEEKPSRKSPWNTVRNFFRRGGKEDPENAVPAEDAEADGASEDVSPELNAETDADPEAVDAGTENEADPEPDDSEPEVLDWQTFRGSEEAERLNDGNDEVPGDGVFAEMEGEQEAGTDTSGDARDTQTQEPALIAENVLDLNGDPQAPAQYYAPGRHTIETPLYAPGRSSISRVHVPGRSTAENLKRGNPNVGVTGSPMAIPAPKSPAALLNGRDSVNQTGGTYHYDANSRSRMPTSSGRGTLQWEQMLELQGGVESLKKK